MTNIIFSLRKFDEDEGRQRLEGKCYKFGQNFSIIWSTKCFSKANFCRLQKFLDHCKLMNTLIWDYSLFFQRTKIQALFNPGKGRIGTRSGCQQGLLLYKISMNFANIRILAALTWEFKVTLVISSSQISTKFPKNSKRPFIVGKKQDPRIQDPKPFSAQIRKF